MRADYCVKHGITKQPLTKKCYATFEQAERIAVQLSLKARYTVEIWRDGVELGWYFQGAKGG